MSDFDFNIGDKVYYPDISNEILILEKTTNPSHPFKVTLEHGVTRSFTTDGRRLYFNEKPSIFPATQEWYDKLVHVYPDLEKPPIKKDPKDIIQAMLEGGYHGVLCQIAMVDEDDENIIHCYRYDYALEVLDDKIIFSHHTLYNDQLKFVSPFHQKSGMEIVDFTNGKIVLQNGEVVLED